MKRRTTCAATESTNKDPKDSSRRQFLATGGKVAAASVLAGAALPRAYAAENNTLQIALVGCGGRGSGAVHNALRSEYGPVKLVAMADLFDDKMKKSYEALYEDFPENVDVPEDRKFIGFDAYKKAIDCLRPGDILVQGTHAAFRATHVEYAVEKGLHVFMEKSFAPDPGGTHRIFRIGEEAKKKNLKIGTGLMCRHSATRQSMIEQIRDGALGEVLLTRAYRMDGGLRLEPFRGGENELLWQIRRPYGLHWISSGKLIDWMIHQIDECAWMKDAWPVSAQGVGGRGPGNPDCSQNYHSYAVEYTFADGTKSEIVGRGMKHCQTEFSTFAHGTKCAAQFSGNVHAPTAHIYKDQRLDKDNIAWTPERESMSPYQVEWDVLLNAIRNDIPHNEVERSANTNVACIMGRAAVHTGQIVTWDDVMASDFTFCGDVSKFTMDSPSPTPADDKGLYPIPTPGEWVEV